MHHAPLFGLYKRANCLPCCVAQKINSCRLSPIVGIRKMITMLNANVAMALLIAGEYTQSASV
ncbi:hypothetical protein EV178_006602, partial [Coemansia sp. RSA 1646]